MRKDIRKKLAAYAMYNLIRNSWKDECTEGYEYGVNPYDYNSKEDYLFTLHQAKYGWRDWHTADPEKYGISFYDYETEEDFEEAVKKAKYGWRNNWEHISNARSCGLDLDNYETEDEFLKTLKKAKYRWRDDWKYVLTCGLDPEDYETEEKFIKALKYEEKYGWRKFYQNDPEYSILDPQNFET